MRLHWHEGEDARCLVQQDSLSTKTANKTQVVPVKRALQLPAAYVLSSCASSRRLLLPRPKARNDMD